MSISGKKLFLSSTILGTNFSIKMLPIAHTYIEKQDNAIFDDTVHEFWLIFSFCSVFLWINSIHDLSRNTIDSIVFPSQCKVMKDKINR